MRLLLALLINFLKNFEKSFWPENQKYNFLVSMDSRSYTFKGDQEFIVEKSKFYVNLIHPNNFDFFETLRKKLNWGFDLRN